MASPTMAVAQGDSRSDKGWHLLNVLPNLDLPDSGSSLGSRGLDLNTDQLVIVGSSDDRVKQLRAVNPVVDQIASSFRDVRGEEYAPAMLIVRASAPERVRHNADAIVAFRNAVALSIVLKARAAGVKGEGGISPSWSDIFDFHPVQISPDNRVIMLSPAVRMHVATVRPLNLTPSPWAPVESYGLWPDPYLYRALGDAWRRRYGSRGVDKLFGRALFRSLEVAYNACGVPTKNQESIHDYGLQVALWVSAIEILAWPKERHASPRHVLHLLEKAPLHRVLGKRRYRAKLTKSGSPTRLNALGRAYSYLYRARNRFLHGNPVSPATLFTLRRGAPPAPVPRLAAVVYRAALAAYLFERHPVSGDAFQGASERLGSSEYDDALAELFGLDLVGD